MKILHRNELVHQTHTILTAHNALVGGVADNY